MRRRTVGLLIAALALSVGLNLYQAYRIRQDESWMVRAYFALQFCSQALHGQENTQ